jgi:Kinesin motor domain
MVKSNAYIITQLSLQTLFKGFSSAVLAYGQTGSGKTYTCFGDERADFKEDVGIVLSTIEAIFKRKRTNPTFIVKISILEIHNDTLIDLLAPENVLEIREVNKNTFVQGRCTFHKIYENEFAFKT